MAAITALVLERLWWPGESNETAFHVKTCDDCHRSGVSKPYKTVMSVPMGGLFDVFSVYFPEPFPESPAKNRFLIVYVELLTG